MSVKKILKKAFGQEKTNRTTEAKALVFGWGTSGSTYVVQCIKMMDVLVHKEHRYNSVDDLDSYRLKLFTIRDPRDVIASNAKRVESELWNNGKQTQALENELERFFAKESMETYNRAVNDKDVVVVKYETFFNGNEVLLLNFISDQLGLNLDQEKLREIHLSNSIEKNVKRAAQFEDFSKWDKESGIHGNHITNKGLSGGWRDTFTDDFLKIAKEKLTPSLIRLGYETNNNWS